MFIKKREIVACIIFTIITCGIYGLYWMYKMNDEINAITGTRDDTSGGIVILLIIVTCGLYGIYWSYKMGDKIDYYHGTSSSKGILYLIITLIGFSIITCALIQDEINKILNRNKGGDIPPSSGEFPI